MTKAVQHSALMPNTLREMSRSARVRLTWEREAGILTNYEKREMTENIQDISEVSSWSKVNFNLAVSISHLTVQRILKNVTIVRRHVNSPQK